MSIAKNPLRIVGRKVVVIDPLCSWPASRQILRSRRIACVAKAQARQSAIRHGEDPLAKWRGGPAQTHGQTLAPPSRLARGDVFVGDK